MRQITSLSLLLVLAACAPEDRDTGGQAGQNIQDPATSGGEAADPSGSSTETAEGAPGETSGSSPDGGTDGSSRPIANGDLAWNASPTSRGHKLTYGRPQTDDVRATLRCAGDEVTVQVSPRMQAERRAQLAVSSGGATERVPADVTESMLGGLIVGGDIARDSQVLRNFRSGRPLSVSWGPHNVTVPAQSAQIAEFFRRCS